MGSLKDAGKYLSLADAIQTLKDQLLKAELRAVRERSQMFKLEDVEMELSLEFAPKAGVGFDVYIFKAEVGAEAKGAHKLTLKFKPNRAIIAAALTDAPGTVTLSPKVATSKSGNRPRRARR
ncbi:MAG TPA: trypco2 family protein [Casimicrobiaceae bacterium]|nr:trypco2 family protein [Casimicrobiaceae bacterium]